MFPGYRPHHRFFAGMKNLICTAHAVTQSLFHQIRRRAVRIYPDKLHVHEIVTVRTVKAKSVYFEFVEPFDGKRFPFL